MLAASDFKAADGTDARNYGGLDGLPEMKAIFAELLETTPANLIVGGASSLTMMHDAVVRGLLHGVPDGQPVVQAQIISGRRRASTPLRLPHPHREDRHGPRRMVGHGTPSRSSVQ